MMLKVTTEWGNTYYLKDTAHVRAVVIPRLQHAKSIQPVDREPYEPTVLWESTPEYQAYISKYATRREDE